MTLGQTTMQTMGIALLVMGLIALFFFPSFEAVFWVFFALLSIDLGVLGFLVLWDAELDPMIMTDVVISIGFSIDYAAHFCYLYYRTRETLFKEGLKAEQIAEETLEGVGVAILQCGLSTLIAVTPLGLVNAHIIRFFFRTTVLVVSFGILHAIVLLPIILPAVHAQPRLKRHKRD